MQWWAEDPSANTALITGPLSGICTIDVDGPIGRENAAKLNLPQTLTVKTGRADGGHQYWYKHPGTYVKTCYAQVADGVDVRGDGGLAIIPYSVHATGAIYAFLGGYEAINQPLAPFPQNVLDLLGAGKDAQAYQPVTGSQEPWITEALKGGVSGDRHKTLISLAGYFQSKGLPKDVTLALLLDWDTRNQPPKGADEIRKQVEDVYQRYSQRVLLPGLGQRDTDAGRGSGSPVAITTTASAFEGFKSELVNGAKTIKTGFHQLDGYTRGLLVGNLSVIGAWPGVGKTAFTLGLARSLAEQGRKVLYFPTEMAVNELMRVFVVQGLSIPFARVMDGNLTEEEHVQISDYLSGDLLRRLSIASINTPSLADIASACEQVKPDVLMLDYLQHTANSSDSRRLDISDMIMSLKGLVKQHGCAGVVTSQFHRPYRDDEGNPIPPTMFDFAESAQIEREVSMALLMSPTDERLTDAMEFTVNFNLAKNRFGKVAEFQMKFDQTYVRFSE